MYIVTTILTLKSIFSLVLLGASNILLVHSHLECLAYDKFVQCCKGFLTQDLTNGGALEVCGVSALVEATNGGVASRLIVSSIALLRQPIVGAIGIGGGTSRCGE